MTCLLNLCLLDKMSSSTECFPFCLQGTSYIFILSQEEEIGKIMIIDGYLYFYLFCSLLFC